MLFAYSMNDFVGYTVLFLVAAIYIGKKFASSNSDVANAAKKAAANKAIQLIGRFFK